MCVYYKKQTKSLYTKANQTKCLYTKAKQTLWCFFFSGKPFYWISTSNKEKLYGFIRQSTWFLPEEMNITKIMCVGLILRQTFISQSPVTGI